MMNGLRPKAFTIILLAATAVARLPIHAHAQGAPQEQVQEREDQWSGGEDEIAVGDDDMVELHVVDMPLGTVLRMLSLQGRRNIIASAAVKGTVTADLYGATFEQALAAALTANNCTYRIREDGFIYIYTREEFKTLQIEESPISTRIYRLNYIRAADVIPVVEPLLSLDGKVAKSPDAEVGIEGEGADAGGDSLTYQDFVVVYDYPENLQRIGQIVRELDERPRQVLVEATILRARLTDDNALGVDFTVVGGVDLELLNSTSIGVQNLSVGALPTERFEKFNANASTSFASNVPDGGLTFGVIKDNVGVFIRALEQITDTSVIANPKVLALNKQTGNVIVGRRDGYITTTVTQTQSIQKVEFLETGTQLTFRPFIGTDDFVRMELHPEDSVGGLTAAQLPFEQTTEVTTNIIVRDGHTILIGGLFRELGSESRGQLPLLGDIPFIGDAFRSKSDSLDREEVIILLTVHIIKNESEYADASLKLMHDMERTRVTLRRNMHWHSRERLSQGFYRRATKHFAKGQNKLALWNIDQAIHNYPRFLNAIRLREEITRVRGWEDDTTTGRNFVFGLIHNAQNESSDHFGRPAWQDAPLPNQENSP